MTSPAPTATQHRVARLRAGLDVGQVRVGVRIRSAAATGPMRSIAGIVIAAATATSGTSPRNTQRQPTVVRDEPGERGTGERGHDPRGRQHREHPRPHRRPDSERPIDAYATAGTTPAPRPCTTRASTSSGIDGASPPAMSPTANSTHPAANGSAGPRRSASRPATTVPTRLAEAGTR